MKNMGKNKSVAFIILFSVDNVYNKCQGSVTSVWCHSVSFLTEPWHSRHVLFLCECAASSVLEPCTLSSTCLVSYWSMLFRSRHFVLSFSFVLGFGHSLCVFCLVVWVCSLERALLSTCVLWCCTQFMFFIGCVHSCYDLGLRHLCYPGGILPCLAKPGCRLAVLFLPYRVVFVCCCFFLILLLNKKPILCSTESSPHPFTPHPWQKVDQLTTKYCTSYQSGQIKKLENQFDHDFISVYTYKYLY